MLNISFEDATTIFIYLVPEGMKALAPLLSAALAKNVRIVTYGKTFNTFNLYYFDIIFIISSSFSVFSIPGLVPTKVEIYKNITKIYLYEKQSIK